jgi:aerobic carbon-monoxide dehydrogenase large subunit
MRFGIRQLVTRKEDVRFLSGRGRCVADIDLVREAHAVFVFSPYAHAQIRAVDKSAAEQLPGVYAALTGKDWAADGLGAPEDKIRLAQADTDEAAIGAALTPRAAFGSV